MEFELPKINVSFEYDEEKDEIVFVINGVEKRVKTKDMITEMEKLQEQNTALEQEPCEDCQRIYKPNPYYDCISRQNAIDAMWEGLDENTAHKVRDILELQPSVMPNQEPCGDCISRAEAIEQYTRWYVDFVSLYDNGNFQDVLKNLPSVQPKTETGQFEKWVATEIFDDNWEYNKDAFAEIACRKLEKLGIVRAKGDMWELVEPQESEDKE